MKTLGIKFAKPRNGEAALGWCLLDTGPAPERVILKGQLPIQEDPAEAAVAFALRYPDRVVDLTSYADQATFVGSRAHRDGLSLAQHRELIDRTAKLMRSRGIPVLINGSAA